MKPTIKSSIPLTFFRFSAAIILFIAVEFFSDQQMIFKAAGLYSFIEAKISSDGQVTYRASRRSSADGRILDIWHFDETVQHPQRESPINVMDIFNSTVVSGVRNNAKNIERNSHAVKPIYSEFYIGYAHDAKIPVIWWNGPAGQVDWYDGASRMRVASLGPVGPAVKAPARPEGRFNALQVEGQAQYIATPEGIYALSVPTFFGPTFRAKIFYKGSCEAFALLYRFTSDSRSRLLVVHGSTLSVLNEDGSLLRDINLPDIAASLLKIHFRIYFFENGRVAIDGYRDREYGKTILLLAEDGSLMRRVDYDTSEINKAMNGGVDRADILFPTLMPPIPVPGLMEKSALIQSIALSLVLAAMILWHQTRLGGRGACRVAWVMFVLVFGLLGFVTYLAAYWDRRSEPCPGCRRPRLVAEKNCPHCNASWPAPKPLGIEIVEPA
jgi:hypothetical protein